MKIRKMSQEEAREFTDRIAARAAAIAIGVLLRQQGSTMEDAERVEMELIREIRRRCAEGT